MRRGKVCEAEYVRQFALSIKQFVSPSSDSSDRSAPSELSNSSNYYYKYEKIIFNLIIQFSSKII